MKPLFVRQSIHHLLALLLLSAMTACASPVPVEPLPTQREITAVIPTSTPISDLKGQILKPLILDINDDRVLEPGLAQKWSFIATTDDNTVRAKFVLPDNWASQNNSSLGSEDIARIYSQMGTALWEDPNLVAAGASGNPCIVLTPSGTLSPSSRLETNVSQVDGNDVLTISLKDCGSAREWCNETINVLPRLPVFNPDIYKLERVTSEGRYEFSLKGSAGTVTFDPRTGTQEHCLSCKPATPEPKPICTPTK